LQLTKAVIISSLRLLAVYKSKRFLILTPKDGDNASILAKLILQK